MKAIPTELTQQLSSAIDNANNIIKGVLAFPFLPPGFRSRLQNISTALDNRDVVAAIGEIRDIIYNKFRFIGRLLRGTNLTRVTEQMENLNSQIMAMTETMDNDLDKVCSI